MMRQESLLQRIPNLRRRSWKQILYGCAVCLGGFVYMHVFFFYQPDRTRQRLDAWTLSIQQTEEAKRILKQEMQESSLVGIDGNFSVSQAQDSYSPAAERQQQQKQHRSTLSVLLDWLFFWFAFSFIFRIYLQHCIYPRLLRARANRLHEDLRDRRQRFRQWVTRLNRQREYNGQRPLSMERLSLVLRDRELDGEDYDGLLRFDEEAGPAMEALLNSVGATREEIERCPLRVLQADDDLLVRNRNNDGNGDGSSCPICLEAFVVNDAVRTIPCFHAFHKDCIDPWLAQRASCPICKHNAVG